MTRPLSVLMIEDSEDDAMLIVHELEHGGYEVDWERLDKADAIKDALKRKTWDIILSDHAMPGICAPEALSIVRSSKVSTPFIIVSGWMTEELAESAKKEGANDFVPKNRLSKLVPAIEKQLKAKKSSKPAKKK
jgi:sigma-B regulation protein RsbU (phosphoserine phosphatase)